MGARIGGNVGDIAATAAMMAQTGTAATSAGREASQFSEHMHGQVNEVTHTLNTHFSNLADELRERIRQAKERLQATDWEGTSKSQADAAEAALNQQCDQVLTNALLSTQDFKQFMLARSDEFVSMVQSDFSRIMGEVEQAYGDLDKASRLFAENLQKADESIKFRG